MHLAPYVSFPQIMRLVPHVISLPQAGTSCFASRSFRGRCGRPVPPLHLTFNLEEKSMKKFYLLLVLAGLCATLMFTSPVRSQRKDKLRRNSHKIENSYIVVLDDSIVGERGLYSIAPYIANEMAATHRANLTHVYQNALNGFSATMSAADAEELSQDFRVKFVEE